MREGGSLQTPLHKENSVHTYEKMSAASMLSLLSSYFIELVSLSRFLKYV